MLNIHTLRLAILLGLANGVALNSAAQAQEQGPIRMEPETSGWEFGIGVGRAQLESAAATKAFIGDSADLVTLNVHYYVANSPWMINAGGGSLNYKDQPGFTQVVRDEYSGDTYSEDSSASGTFLFVEAGGHYPLNRALFLEGQLGLSNVSGSSRGIDKCSNCKEEDFDISGGAYGAISFGGTIANTVEVALHYQHYLSGDIASSVGISIGSHFF